MSRKYIKIDKYGKQILEMKAQGKTSREIAQALGVDRECIRHWVFRFNRQQRKLEAGIKLQPKGRPRKDAQPRDIITEQVYEIQRLKMENLLKRFTVCFDDLFVRPGRIFNDAPPGLVIHKNQSKTRVVAFCPLEVVHQRPVLITEHRISLCNGTL